MTTSLTIPSATASLYIHVPFCASICDYCDFFSVQVNTNSGAALLDSFINAVLDDIQYQLSFFKVDTVPTVFIGGGTPSVLGAARMERLLSGIAAVLKTPPAEFTVEANPESADEDFLRACVNGGVNRISLGVQTFHEASRRQVHRPGGGALLEQRLALTAEYFPGAFSADLITGLPFHTAGIVRDDVKRLLAFRPAHVSLYSLMGEVAAADEADAMWICGRDALEENGFAQYEVSNFALPDNVCSSDNVCAHNIRYWRMENWLGAGPAASGTIIDDASGTGRRFTYPADINAYLTAAQPRFQLATIEELGPEELMRETLLMGFRYREGPDPLLFQKRFGRGIEDCIPKTIERWRGRGFFATDDGSLRPSREGLLFLNGFLRDVFGELSGT